jgi:hypothetical protein
MASAYETTFHSMGRWSAVRCARQLGLVACECLDRAAFKLEIRRRVAYMQAVLTARLEGASPDQLPNSDFRNAIVKAVALSFALAADPEDDTNIVTRFEISFTSTRKAHILIFPRFETSYHVWLFQL